jgi:hypothetical protein
VEVTAFVLARLEIALARKLSAKMDDIPSATLAGLVRAGYTDLWLKLLQHHYRHMSSLLADDLDGLGLRDIGVAVEAAAAAVDPHAPGAGDGPGLQGPVVDAGGGGEALDGRQDAAEVHDVDAAAAVSRAAAEAGGEAGASDD